MQPVDEDIFEYIFSRWDIKITIEEEAKKYKQRIQRKKELNDPKENTEFIKNLALDLGADMVGISKVKKEYLFKGGELDHRFAISLAMEMDYDKIQESPKPPSATEVIRVYFLLGEITIKLAAKIRELGYSAFGHHPRACEKTHARILHIPTAIEAGFGELGRHGLLITPEYGPRVRLGTVTTNLPLICDSPISFGVSAFCENCDLCVKECEGEAIPKEKSIVRGFHKYKVDPYKCGPYFAEYDGCSVCMKVCAYNKRPE
jgi:epoxyqueuosine reductase